MLEAMQPAEKLSSSTNPSFAGLLAALTSSKSETAASVSDALNTMTAQPAQAGQTAQTMWSDGLEDDVATLSYERALRANARYKPANTAQFDLPNLPDLPGRIDRLAQMCAEEGAARVKASEGRTDDDGSANERTSYEARTAIGMRHRTTPTLDETRKRASVTVRLSEAEFDQLQQRAQEAGVTVSAYLRSCTFEAEALRAQVKEALAQLKAEKQLEKAAMDTVDEKVAVTKNAAARSKAVARSSWRQWLVRLFPQLPFAGRMARA